MINRPFNNTATVKYSIMHKASMFSTVKRKVEYTFCGKVNFQVDLKCAYHTELNLVHP